MKEKRLSYDDSEEKDVLNYDTENTDDEIDPEEEERKAKRKRNIIRILIGVGIIIAILLLGFGIRKNRIAAVLSDEAQDQLISELSGYINEIQGSYISEEDAHKIAEQVITENFGGDTTINEFLSLTKEEIQQMIDDSLTNYMEDYYTKSETNEQIDNAVTEVTELITADISELQRQIDEIRITITDITDSITELDEKVDNTKDELDGKIDDTKDELNTKIDDTKDELNTKIDDTKDELDGKIDDTKNELDKKIDKNVEILQSEIDTISDNIDVATLDTPLISYVWNVDVLGSDSDDMDWHIKSVEHDISKMTIKEYVDVLAGNDIEFTESINKLYEYVKDSDQEIYNVFNTSIADLREDMEEQFQEERETRQTQIDELNTKIEETTTTLEEAIKAGDEATATEAQRQLNEAYNELYALIKQNEADINNNYDEYKTFKGDTNTSITDIYNKLGGNKLWTGTRNQYNNISHDAGTLYFVTE